TTETTMTFDRDKLARSSAAATSTCRTFEPDVCVACARRLETARHAVEAALSAVPVEGEVEWRRISPKGIPVTWPIKTHPGEEPGWTVERRAVLRGPW